MRALGDDESRTVGPYRLIAELGRGGMGRVLLGAAPDGRLVAVKQIRAALAEEDGFVARFRREVATSRQVSGAYTAAVVDADVTGTAPWLASVFVPGPSLQDTVDVTGVLPAEPALRLAAGLAAALGEIHRAGLVHRDLKPSNVLLAADGVRVIDFGIARAVDGDATELTRSGWLIGSPGFMSPEQAEGHELTAASDVFSLGAVLVMACTGQSPFAGSSTPRTLYNVVHAEPDLEALPTEVRRIAALCLVKEPADRPSPADLLTAIGPVTPSTTPWPAEVHRLIEKQHAEVAALLGGAAPEVPAEEVVPEGTVDLRTTAGPTVTHPAEPAPPPRLRRRGVLVAALAAVVVAAAVAGLMEWSPWSSRSGEPAYTVEDPASTLDGHTGTVNDIAYSPDGTKLVTGSDDDMVRLWDLTRNRQLAEWDTGDDVRSVAFNPDGTLIATISGEADVMVWDVGKRERTGNFDVGDATDVAFSHDGTQLAVAGGHAVELLNLANLDDYSGLPLSETDWISAIAFSPDGTLAVGAGESVFGWNPVSRMRTDLVVRTQSTVADVAFTPDGRTMAVADNTETVVLWDVAGGRRAGMLTAPEDSYVRDLAFNSDGTVLGTDSSDDLGTQGTYLRLWDVPGRRELAAVPIRPDTKGFALSPDGRTLVTAARSGAVLLYRR
jgi:eukaryotic-like serine/threonine-protein kinase